MISKESSISYRGDVPVSFSFAPVQKEIDITGFHSVSYFEFDTEFCHPPEQHDFWELVYVDYGRFNVNVDGIIYELSKGQVIFHQPTEIHSHFANEESAGNIVVIAFSCDSPCMSFFQKKIFSLERSSQKLLSMFLSEAEAALGGISHTYTNSMPLDFSKAQFGSPQLMQCYLVEFLFSLFRYDKMSVCKLKQTSGSRQSAEPSQVDSILQYMQANLNQPPTLSTLCNHFSISKSYLCRIFREAVGDSPVDFWIALKIKEAKKLIREDGYNITQISDQLGYTSIHHFTRMFKRYTGMSPTAYKTSIGK